MTDLPALLEEVRTCRLCAAHLPLGPRPVVQLHTAAPILIIGQAPGTKVHETGIPFNDPSGDRLRDWLGVDRETFYDPTKIALMPSGFCYPGPLPQRWRSAARARNVRRTGTPRLRPHLAGVRLTLLVGQYAQALYLGKARKRTLGETVQAWQDYLPDVWPTPHPSWRVNLWLKKNPWFEADALPALRTPRSRPLG